MSTKSFRTSACVFLLVTTFSSTSIFAQNSPISFGIYTGMAYLPLSDFWPTYCSDNKRCQKDNLNLSYGLNVKYAIADNHTIIFGADRIKAYAPYILDLLEDITDFYEAQYKFRLIPLMAGYEFSFLPISKNLKPIAGIGFVYLFGNVNQDDSYIHWRQSGKTYGIYTSIGIISKLADQFSLVFMGRYRYVATMLLERTDIDMELDFSGYDISLGLEWNY